MRPTATRPHSLSQLPPQAPCCTFTERGGLDKVPSPLISLSPAIHFSFWPEALPHAHWESTEGVATDTYYRWNNRARKSWTAPYAYLVVHELEIDPFQGDLQQATLSSLHVLHRELST
jgi:hypothetical protein